MDLNDLPGLITKHIGMVQAAAGKALENPALTAMTGRQSVWAESTDTAVEKRAQLYDKMLGDDRPILEHLAGISDATAYATSRQREVFDLKGASGGDGDTFRHMTLSAKLQREHPLHAQDFGDAHEMGLNPFRRIEAEDSRDYHNNRLGRKIGEVTSNDTEADILIQHTMPRSTPNVQSFQFGPLASMVNRQATWRTP